MSELRAVEAPMGWRLAIRGANGATVSLDHLPGIEHAASLYSRRSRCEAVHHERGRRASNAIPAAKVMFSAPRRVQNSP
jgi:hypothetical protein